MSKWILGSVKCTNFTPLISAHLSFQLTVSRLPCYDFCICLLTNKNNGEKEPRSKFYKRTLICPNLQHFVFLLVSLIVKTVHFQTDPPAWPAAAPDDDSLTYDEPACNDFENHGQRSTHNLTYDEPACDEFEPTCNDACTQTESRMKRSCKVM